MPGAECHPHCADVDPSDDVAVRQLWMLQHGPPVQHLTGGKGEVRRRHTHQTGEHWGGRLLPVSNDGGSSHRDECREGRPTDRYGDG